MDEPGHPEPRMITDAAVNIAPSLKDKIDIVQNAIELAHDLGAPEVRVAILSAMETVNPDVPSTLEAAALCKMADRKQITGAVLDGPLALDNAIDPEAARIKKNRFTGGGAGQLPGGAGSRSWQHAREESDVPCRRGCRRDCPGRAGADHINQSGGYIDCAARLLRGGGAGGRSPSRPERQSDRRIRWLTSSSYLTPARQALNFRSSGYSRMRSI
jgi:hypothetical protein